MDIKKVLTKLAEKENLSVTEARELMDQFMEGKLTHAQMGAILAVLRGKKETSEEILGFIRSMREHAKSVELIDGAIDTCGTGGDGKNTFNISTTVALVVTGAGGKVAKHGNRAASSKCGSADVLEALGVNINLTPQQAVKLLNNVGITFFFAPLYHPAMKYVAPVRRELGIRTVFNFLGPFVNPGRVKRQLIGVSDRKIASKLAATSTKLGYSCLLLVTAEDGMDEISIFSPTQTFEIRRRKINRGKIVPEDYGIVAAPISALRGGSAKENALIIKRILTGEEGPRKDIVLINSAVALYVAGKAETIIEGLQLARESVDRGAAFNVLERLVTESQKYA